MRQKRHIRIITFMMALTFVITSCGKKYKDAPELIEPLAVNESFRTVEYGSVGNFEIRFGTVVPTDHCYFWTTIVSVAEIKVDIGDWVNEGDVVAVADLDVARETIASIQKDIELRQSLKTENDRKYELQKQELTYKLMGCQEIGDKEAEASVNVQISVLEENHRYDDILFSYNIDRLNEEIAKQQEIIEGGTLVAASSGYVSYVKDLSDDNRVNNLENVVVVSDYDAGYVELTDESVDSDILERYPVVYAEVDGKRCKLTEYSYTKDELLVAQSRSMYPKIRFKFDNEADMPQIGNSVPVTFQKSVKDNVLIVGNDSIYTDDKGSFVYVKEGGMREIRYVELGESDAYNSEVISGLSCGDAVYYASESILPEHYSEYKVELKDFIANEKTNSYAVENTRKLRYFSEYEGTVEELYVKEGQEVSEGELICVIRVNEGSARLTEMRNAIKGLKDSYEQSVKSYDEQLLAVEAQMAEYLAAKEEGEKNQEQLPGETSTPTDSAEIEVDADIEQEDPYIYEELECQLEQIKTDKKISEINYIYQLEVMEDEYAKASSNNDGAGAVKIYADRAGTLKNLSIRAGRKIKTGDKLYNIEIPAGNKILLRTTAPVELNRTIEFIDTDTGKHFEGKVRGNTGYVSGQKYYITSVDGRVQITESISNVGERYYVILDDETFYENFTNSQKYTAKYSTDIIEKAVVLPYSMVYTEIDPSTKKALYYVWRIIDGSLVKQYVNVVEGMVDGKKMYCVIKGVKAGDVLAKETDGTEGGDSADVEVYN